MVELKDITGVGFQPDWLWGKKRNATGHHFSFDSVRGADQKNTYTDSSTAEAHPANYV